MLAVGKNVLVEVPKTTEEKIGAIIVLGRNKHQINGTIVSVGCDINDARVTKGKLVVALDVSEFRIIRETDTSSIIAVPYDYILAVEE